MQGRMQGRMRTGTGEQDNRMSPGRWWLLAGAMPPSFGAFCLLTHSWTPLQDGWPLIVVVVILAAIRQGAALYERRAARRDTPHA